MVQLQFSLKRMLAWITVATAALGISRWQHWPPAAIASLVLLVGGAEIDRLRGRTGPAMLRSLSDLSDYHASTAEFSVNVDLDKDVKYVPSAVGA